MTIYRLSQIWTYMDSDSTPLTDKQIKTQTEIKQIQMNRPKEEIKSKIISQTNLFR